MVNSFKRHRFMNQERKRKKVANSKKAVHDSVVDSFFFLKEEMDTSRDVYIREIWNVHDDAISGEIGELQTERYVIATVASRQIRGDSSPKIQGATESVVRSCVRRGTDMLYRGEHRWRNMSESETRRATRRQLRRRRDDVRTGVARGNGLADDARRWRVGKVARDTARRGVIQRKSPVRHVGVGPETT